MTPLMQAVDDYLQMRRAMGFKLRREGWRLPHFVRFLEGHGATYITNSLAMRWALESSVPDTTHAWRARLQMVRSFAQFWQAHDARTEIPPKDTAPTPRRRRTSPYVYSDQDIQILIRATRSLTPFKADTYATVFGLLAATGLRVGEAIRLDRSDVCWRDATLLIRQTKFGKSREVPLHPSTIAALQRYASLRETTLAQPQSDAFFLSLSGKRLIHQNVHHTFLRLVQRTELAHRQPKRPTLHDLRHTFAVNTVIRWHQLEVDVPAHLPHLSTYLGHAHPESTYWYLTATPELLRLASRRLERAQGGLQ